jgi:type III restriction enzyme
MDNRFFEQPILNSPYAYPARHWELDASGQPTQQITETRRRAEFITPIPKPKKRKGAAEQQQIVFDEGKGLTYIFPLMAGWFEFSTSVLIIRDH